ncbi:META domain-containing protein [Egbenema bharatensis]|uniref:META domain-containing protein n=1 Tax=Egbenema bharatensis TaxID=3463334 RepID=UPI003A86FC2A
MKKNRFFSMLGVGLTIATLGWVQEASGMMQLESEWHNCLTREVFTPEQQAWCDRLSELAQLPEPEPANDSFPLKDTLWYLTSYINEAGETVAAQTYIEPPSLLFRDGQVGGSNGCNRFFGSYALDENGLDENGLDENALSIQVGGSTLIACPEEFAAQETAFLTGLTQVTRFTIANDELQLLNAEGEALLTFSPADQPSLTGTLWQLIGYNNGQGGVVSLITDTRITATFDDEGGITGFAGCNHYIAPYQVTETAIDISPAISTRKLCSEPEGVMAQETAYLQALETAIVFTIEGNTLTLRTDTGATAARFRAETED